jgi:hypothetical protein
MNLKKLKKNPWAKIGLIYKKINRKKYFYLPVGLLRNLSKKFRQFLSKIALHHFFLNFLSFPKRLCQENPKRQEITPKHPSKNKTILKKTPIYLS